MSHTVDGVYCLSGTRHIGEDDLLDARLTVDVDHDVADPARLLNHGLAQVNVEKLVRGHLLRVRRERTVLEEQGRRRQPVPASTKARKRLPLRRPQDIR
nr:hypothetical protein [Gordonia sp. SCSIO 19800]